MKILLAESAYGRVWVDGEESREVTKVVDATDPNAMREVRCLRRIHHPNVIRLLGIRIEGGLLSMRFPRYPMDLDMFINNCKSANTQAVRVEIVRQILLGVRAMHRARVVHADLKPANIFLQLEPHIRAVVGDLGTSMIALPGKKDAYFTTEAYRAPEIMVQPKTDAYPEKLQYLQFKADAWAIGVITHNLMTGAAEINVFCDDLFWVWGMFAVNNPKNRMSVSEALKLRIFQRPARPPCTRPLQ